MIIAANFKTNKTRVQTRVYLESLNAFMKELNTANTAMVFPPLTALDSFELESNVKVGAQNAFSVENGAFTGEVGLEQLEEFAVQTILIGHSERRHILGESQEEIANKFNFFKEQGFEIVYCIGEPLEVRQEGNEALVEYIDAQLEGIDLSYEKLVVAYEPVWAIGTGKVATVHDIELVLSNLKTKISAPILYGGSVKVANIKEILEIASCDGALVGGASLDVEAFKQMIEIAKDT